MTIDRISQINPDALLADGFEDAIIGMCMQFGQSPVVTYDYKKCIEILQERDDMTEDEASEYMDYNVIGAYMGLHSPVFLIR